VGKPLNGCSISLDCTSLKGAVNETRTEVTWITPRRQVNLVDEIPLLIAPSLTTRTGFLRWLGIATIGEVATLVSLA
jgi:hypothetical protein